MTVFGERLMAGVQFQAPQGSGQITELQSLRGIAAATVMIGHCLISYGPSALLIGLSELLTGRSEVAGFFVPRGYGVTCPLQRRRFNPDAVLGFYVRRGF